MSSMELVDDGADKRQVAATPKATGSTPSDLIRYAMESGADLDRLERLMDMQVKWEAREAEKAFAAAMAEFSANPPRVFKDKHVDFKTQAGRTQYDHATIGNACDIIKSALALHGFSHRWVTTQPDNKVRVECIITHRLGHSQSNSLESGPDKSGGKNDIQAIISARTYLERHTLFDATGCAPLDSEDDDGAAGSAATEEKEPSKHPIYGPAFDKALLSIKDGKYTAEEMRGYYALTPDQETALSDLLAELKK